MTDQHPTDNNTQKLLRPKEAATLIGLTTNTIRAYVRQGKIPCVRLGGPNGPIRFDLRELHAWINQNRQCGDSVHSDG